MKTKLKTLALMSFGLLTLASRPASAYPVVDQPARIQGELIMVYPDHQTPNAYWYIPQSIEPWKRNNLYRSAYVRTANSLTFVFRGQASVDDEVLKAAAAALGTSVSNFSPIAYEYSRNFQCQNVFDPEKIKWIFPRMIGNYLEIVPVSLRTSDPQTILEVEPLLTSSTGLGCTVEVGFKGVTTAYRFEMTADLNQIYSRFEAAAHAEALWWEADIHTLLESLRRDSVITLKTLEDTSIPQTELDKKANAAMDEVVKQITASLFTPALKLPDGPMAGRGKAFSLRMDYRRSEQSAHYQATLESGKVLVKDSQISLRLSTQ